MPGTSGAYVATGHGPWGMLNAPATGLALAELIADGAAASVDLEPFDPARLAAARRAFMRPPGRQALIELTYVARRVRVRVRAQGPVGLGGDGDRATARPAA